jgi:hypothetical protein
MVYIVRIFNNYGERTTAAAITYKYRYKKQQQQHREDKNEALAKRYSEDIYQEGNLEVADETLSSDFVLYNPTLPEELHNGPEGAKKYAPAIITDVPDRKRTRRYFCKRR